MMKLISIRIETELGELIEKMADKQDRTRSEIIRDLIRVGIGVQKEGGLEIVGPLGKRRSLARLPFKGRKKQITIWIAEDLVREVKEQFLVGTGTAARRAMRLGTFLIRTEEIRITGPFKPFRPFAGAKVSIKDDNARKALERLQK